MSSINSKIEQKLNLYNSLVIPSIENFSELEELIPNFGDAYHQFSSAVAALKNSVISFLQNGGALNVNLQILTPIIATIIPRIDAILVQNNQFLENRNVLINELNELNAKEFLFNNKTV